MTEKQLIEALAEYFHINSEPDGSYNLNDSDWQGGCHFQDGIWLNLANVVEAVRESGNLWD